MWYWLLLLLALATSTHLAPQPECAPEQELSMALGYSTNATGHRRLSARLEQPLGSRVWELQMQVGTSACGAGGARRRSFHIELIGLPEDWFLTPSPATPVPSSSPSPFLPALLSMPTDVLPLASSPSTLTPASPPPGYLTLPGLGHYRVPPVANTWFGAKGYCISERLKLLVATSRREVDLLRSHFSPNATGAEYNDRWWYGADDLYTAEGKFETVDGVPLESTGYSQFYGGSPPKYIAKNCLMIRTDGLLDHEACSSELSFICKIHL